jgi:hypothetical protein
MHINSDTSVATLKGLKADTDPRVRDAADQALVSMGFKSTEAEVPTMQPAQAVQPASATEPAPKEELKVPAPPKE